MTNRTDKLLRECLASGDTGAWLAQNPEHRERLLPYLKLHAALLGTGAPEPAPEGAYRSQQKLLHALSRREEASRRPARLPVAFMRLGTVVAAVALTLVAAAGASAAFGSGGVSLDDVFSTLGFNDHASNGIDNASPSAERGRDCASTNAFDGHGNAAPDADNAADAHEGDTPRCVSNGEGQGEPSDNADEQSDNAEDKADNASDNAQSADNANPNATQGSDNADEGSDNATPDADPPD